MDAPLPTLMPLGDSALLIRFATRLDDAANRAAVALARRLAAAPPLGVIEIVPSLVSVLVRYEPRSIGYGDLAGALRLTISAEHHEADIAAAEHTIPVRFGGEDGPDLAAVAEQLGLSVDAFVAAHNAKPLRMLATGFAPGFVYCGMHAEDLHVPRRQEVRPNVPAGSVLFAAGQTAITATTIPTGWSVIGRTAFSNFDAEATPPTILRAGDIVSFTRES